MFHYLNGEIEEILLNSVVVDINGLGFLVNTSLKTISEVKLGQRVKLYITESIGESNFDLYGFADLQEKKFFELLISVSGVGPKAAISLLSSLTTDQLLMAIINDDSKLLTSAPGIGKKIAQRITMELKDKLSNELPTLPEAATQGTANRQNSEQNAEISDAVAALMTLGYSSTEINPIIRAGDWAGMRAEQIIRSVLKNMI